MATARAAPPLAAFVLHSYDWSEGSLVVDLFTRAQGREVVVAKGAKRPTSNFRPVLLPFHPLMVWLSRAAANDEQGEVRSLRAAEWAGGQPLPPGVLMSGFYLNELVLKGLARHDPHPALFDAYADTLAALAAAPQDEAVALRAFELVLLRELGWLPELSTETASAEPVVAARRYTLRGDSGLVSDAEGPPGSAWVALQAALLHGSLDALRQACAPAAAALRQPLRHLVQYHLASSASAQLRTRRVQQQLQRLAGGPAHTLHR
jgi:DNA repair protein RecO (recombination protein O)